MVIPADPEEMKQFQAQCVAQCQCAVDINLPLAYILLPSKQAFQSIYNRYINRSTCVMAVHQLTLSRYPPKSCSKLFSVECL